MNSQRQTRVLSDAALNGSPTRPESFFDLPALFLDTLVLFFLQVFYDAPNSRATDSFLLCNGAVRDSGSSYAIK